MKLKKIASLFFFLLLVTMAPAQKKNTSYLINRGDIIDVMVMEHPEFSLTSIPVLPDGHIQYPVIGSIMVAGMTSEELTKSIEKAVEKYVVNPVASVFIRKLQNQMLNVLGNVNRPGQFQIFEGVDLLSALSMAGGVKNIRSDRPIYIIRANQTVEKTKLSKYLNTSDAVKPPMLYAGDTVYVKEPSEISWAMLSFIATMLLVAANILAILL